VGVGVAWGSERYAVSVGGSTLVISTSGALRGQITPDRGPKKRK